MRQGEGWKKRVVESQRESVKGMEGGMDRKRETETHTCPTHTQTEILSKIHRERECGTEGREGE